MTKSVKQLLLLLTTKQLENISKNLKLGYGHLKSNLSEQELNALMLDNPVTATHVKTNKLEKAGHISLIGNTIITSCLGAWLGFAGFTHYDLHHPITLVISVISLLMGALGGYVGFWFIQARAIKAIRIQKILHLQETILECTIQKRVAKINDIKDIITSKIHKITNEEIEDLEKIAWLEILSLIKERVLNTEKTIKEKNLLQNYNFGSCKILYDLQKTIRKLTNLKKTRKQNFKPHERIHYLKPLLIPIHASIPEDKFFKWIKGNGINILSGLMPTLFGGFASLFVFLNGIPAIVSQLNIHLSPATAEFFKYSSWFSLAAITLYFGWSWTYTNYKDHVRMTCIEKFKYQLIEKEYQSLYLVRYYNLLTKMATILEDLMLLLNLTEAKLSQQKNNTNYLSLQPLIIHT